MPFPTSTSGQSGQVPSICLSTYSLCVNPWYLKENVRAGNRVIRPFGPAAHRNVIDSAGQTPIQQKIPDDKTIFRRS